MGRTLATATQLFQEEQAALARFRRALRREDQLVLDELFAAAHRHLAAAGHAAHVSPFETLLLAMLIEQHKLVKRAMCNVQRVTCDVECLSRSGVENALCDECTAPARE